MSCWGEFRSQTRQSPLRSRPSPNLYDLPTATCNLEPPSSLSPTSSAPFSPTANNKEPDEVTVGGNVCHQIGCVIFGICDANHTWGLPCNPSRYWFLQDKELKHAPKGYSDRLGAGFRQWVGSFWCPCDPVELFCFLSAWILLWCIFVSFSR